MPFSLQRVYGPAQPVATVATPAAPTLSASGTGTSVTATQKWFVVTFVNPRGETVASATATITPAAGNTITVTVPAFPATVTKANVYEGTASGGPFYLQGSVTASGGTLAVTTEPSSSNATPPATNGATILTANLVLNPALSTGSILKEINLCNSFQAAGNGGIEVQLNGYPIVSLSPIKPGQTVLLPFAKALSATDTLQVLQVSAANLIEIDMSVEVKS